jgi:PHD/YefM family antitoxin component YafN of YafNO toxin-antitoxin module
MVNLTDIHSLTDFQRNVKTHLKHLKHTGRPAVLTVNGKAELVVQDAASYQRLLDLVEWAEAVAGIQRGLDEVKRGKTRSFTAAVEAVGRKHKKV